MKKMLKRDWKQVKFGEVVRQIKNRVDPETAGLTRYVAGEHMDTDELRIRRWGQIGDDYLGPAFHMHFKPGQVLYGSRRTYLRKVAVPDFEGICANTTFVLEPQDPNVLLPELLPFVMQTEAFHDHSIKQSKGSVNPYVNFSDLAWYEFALPPLDEQHRIALLLKYIEGALVAMSKLLFDLEQLRKSFLVDSFTRLLSDQNTVITKVKNVGEVLMGRQLSPKYRLGISPRPYLRVANVFDNYIDTTDVKTMDFTDNEFEQFKLNYGDVLLNEGQSRELVGRSSIFRNEVSSCCFQNTLIRFRPKKVTSEFAQSYFQFCLYTGRFIAISKQTTSIAHLGAKRFEEMEFPLVITKIGQELSDHLSMIESNIALATIRKEQVNQFKIVAMKNELHGS